MNGKDFKGTPVGVDADTVTVAFNTVPRGKPVGLAVSRNVAGAVVPPMNSYDNHAAPPRFADSPEIGALDPIPKPRWTRP